MRQSAVGCQYTSVPPYLALSPDNKLDYYGGLIPRWSLSLGGGICHPSLLFKAVTLAGKSCSGFSFSGFVLCLMASGVAQTEGPTSPSVPCVITPDRFASFHVVTIIA